MAGIIAQINRANWERKKGFRKQLASDKSNVHINWFPDDYDFKDSNWYLRCEKWKRDKRKQEQLEFYSKLMTQEKNILNDGVDCFAANLHKVRLKNEHKAETRSHDKVLDPLVSCLAIVFLAMFIFVFLFLLITFWNVGPVVSVDTEGKGTTAGEPAAALASASASSAGGARAIISYLTARRSNPVSQLKSLLGKSDRLTPPSGQTD